jgi:cytochrome c
MKQVIISHRVPKTTGRHEKSCLLFFGLSFFFSLPAFAADTLPNGDVLYNKYCSVCHTMSPPVASAPAIKSVAALYRRKYPQKTEGVARIAAFVKLPSLKNALDQDAISRFGLMARVPATGKEIQAVAEWLWDQGGIAILPLKIR